MLHPWIRGCIWAYGVPTQYARFDAVVLWITSVTRRSRCYTKVLYLDGIVDDPVKRRDLRCSYLHVTLRYIVHCEGDVWTATC